MGSNPVTSTNVKKETQQQRFLFCCCMLISLKLLQELIYNAILKKNIVLQGDNMKKFFAEFKKFIARGNVVDMAVGVIIGGAFSAIVTALTDKILMPIVNWFLTLFSDGEGMTGAVTILSGTPASDGSLEGCIYINWGEFITAIINFLLIALVLFLIIKALNAASTGLKKNADKFAPLSKEEVKALRKEGKSYAEIEQIAKEKAAADAQAAALAAEEAAKNAPKTQEQLLGEIVELLKEKK